MVWDQGAVCFMCHNTRNGVISDAGVFLHEDSDPRFGNPPNYTAPHYSSQGDVFWVETHTLWDQLVLYIFQSM
jgi:hypothetical protein